MNISWSRSWKHVAYLRKELALESFLVSLIVAADAGQKWKNANDQVVIFDWHHRQDGFDYIISKDNASILWVKVNKLGKGEDNKSTDLKTILKN